MDVCQALFKIFFSFQQEMFGFWPPRPVRHGRRKTGHTIVENAIRQKSTLERTIHMNRHQLPPMGAEPDLSARITEVRLAERSQGHERRSAGEARP